MNKEQLLALQAQGDAYLKAYGDFVRTIPGDDKVEANCHIRSGYHDVILADLKIQKAVDLVK